MAIPTSRTKEKATITIDDAKCNGCGVCVAVCKDFSLEIKNGKATESSGAAFGCFACGHCMAVCPHGAISVTGRFLSPADIFELPPPKEAASYDQLMALLNSRRSIREYKEKPVEKEIIDKIIAAAQTAPMGLPPSDVNVLVLDTHEKNRVFADDFCRYVKKMKWLFSGLGLLLMRPFISKASYEMFRDFVRPLVDAFSSQTKEKADMVLYDAPLAMYFYGSPYTDPADPIIAATYAMQAAEVLGLGTCIIGSVHPFIQNGGAAKQFRKKHGIKYKSREGLFVIFGYPAVKYHKGISRSFASVTIYGN